MANTKISGLTALTGADVATDDAFVVVDTSATATKKITKTELDTAKRTAHQLFATDNTHDIGAAGATRPRYVRAGSALVTASSTVASLPAAGTAGAGAIAYVTDATATTARSIVAGGGANAVLVMSNGTNWLIVA